MALPRASRFSSFGGAPPRVAAKPSLVLGIGSRARVRSGSANSRRVTLTDDAGTESVATLPDGVEVEILAWRPRGGETRYRVASSNGGIEGWLGVGSLERAEPRPAPRPAAVTSNAPLTKPGVRAARPAAKSAR
jgi:hypothetical protein